MDCQQIMRYIILFIYNDYPVSTSNTYETKQQRLHYNMFDSSGLKYCFPRDDAIILLSLLQNNENQ